MSYFICGYKTNHKATQSLDNIFVSLVPGHLRNITSRIESGALQLVVHGKEKVIRDIVIRDGSGGSWLALIGTPLVRLESPQQEQEFLDDFLKKPDAALCNKVEGNIAILCYDAQNDRFIAATDFNNTTPIFYTVTPDGIFFSSHELALAKYLKSDIDPFGFGQAIHLSVTWNSHTRFRNIHKIPACQIAIFNERKELQIKSYWQPQNETVWTGSLEKHIGQWIPILRDSVWKFFECSDRKPVITDFTAGEDARLILAQCHALGIPFKAHVTGLPDSIDVIVAKQAAKEVGFELIERRKEWISEEQLLTDVINISLDTDAYQGLFALCSEFATDVADPLDDYGVVKLGGAPGGEAFRGSYYLRGKAVFPSKKSSLDYKFFTNMKYLLDYYPGLLRYSNNDFLQEVYEIVEHALEDVKEFPIGTQIDHMLRMFQTCSLGLRYKTPFYLPFATSQMTRSVYSLPPKYKQGGRLTKACTEILFPELAFVKTQNGVPTVRKTVLRMPLFVPEYVSIIKKIVNGATSRLFKWRQSGKWYYSQDLNAYIFTVLLNDPPFSGWLSSSKVMLTGHLYNPAIVDPLLAEAKSGSCRYIPILGRIISQEIVLRWVYGVESL